MLYKLEAAYGWVTFGLTHCILTRRKGPMEALARMWACGLWDGSLEWVFIIQVHFQKIEPTPVDR